MIDNDVAETIVTAEVTLQFLVADMDVHEQNLFVGEMDGAGFGLAQEGSYRETTPPLLTEKLPRTATFTFLAFPGTPAEADHCAAEAIADAFEIARWYRAYLLTARCGVPGRAA